MYARTFGGYLIPICQKASLGTLQVKRCRVECGVEIFVEINDPHVEGGGVDP
jgi:ribosomal protein L19